MLDPYTLDVERNYNEYKESKDFEDKYFWWVVFVLVLLALLF